MRGHYAMQSDEGETFDVEIPEFSLDLPGARRVVN
jgi:ApaG protein